MKKEIIDIRDFSDSKEMLLSKPNPFITGFAYTIFFLLITSIVFMCFAKIDVYVLADGEIRPNDGVSSISTMVTGKATDVLVNDGDIVEKGDILLKIDTSNLEIALKELDKKQEEYEFEAKMLDKYIEGLENESNPFSSEIESKEYFYYIDFLNYTLNYRNEGQTIKYDREINDANIQSMSAKLSDIDNTLSGLKAYKLSVIQNENLCGDFPKYESMYNAYEAEKKAIASQSDLGRKNIEAEVNEDKNSKYKDYYTAQIAGYDLLIKSITEDQSYFENSDSEYYLMYREYELKKEDYLRSNSDPVICANQVETYRNGLIVKYKAIRDEIKTKLDDLGDQSGNEDNRKDRIKANNDNYVSLINERYYHTLADIDTSIDSLEKERNEIESDLKMCQILKLKQSESMDNEGSPLLLEMHEADKKRELLEKKEQVKEQIRINEGEIEKVKNEIKDGFIYAEQDGAYNSIKTVVSGDVVNSHDVIGTIIPVNENGLKVRLYVNNAHMAGVDVGDEIKYEVAAFPYTKYGTVEGKITSISKDTMMLGGEHSGYFIVEGTIENKDMMDSDENEGKIEVGMHLKGRIITGRKTIISYLVEKLS